ncbi:Protein of unknown function [Cotesia congregata]|uniref:Uncharacterized protein n=1 Tax=Cotesia congregata TaxID=51543 RepID=A0A8J2H826_COTCN|nr:Protein of unknown function [Cotesia congregata]
MMTSHTFASTLTNIKINCTIIPFEKLSLGDTIDETFAVVYGNIINSNNEIPSIIKSLTKSVKNLPTWSTAQFTCSKTLNSLFEDSVEEKNLFKKFDKRKINDQLFNIDKKYLNNNHTCLLFELCKSEKQTYEEFVNIFEEKYFDKHYDDYYWYHEYRPQGKHIEILKFIRGNETHFVSAIHNGDCLYQIFIFNTESENTSAEIDYKKKTPEYTSKIKMASDNHIFEESLTYSLNTSHIFLFNFPNIPLKVTHEVLNYLSLYNVMSVELTALPKLPRSLEFKEDEIESPKKRSKLVELEAGDSFNINDLISNSVLKSRNMLDFKIFNSIEYSNPYSLQVTNYSDIIMDRSLPCREFVTKYFGDKNNKDYEKLKPFNCLLEEKSYGIDEKFFNENYTRDEIKICLVLEEQKMGIDPLEIVYLNEKTVDGDYNIFENENVVLRFRKSNETHYVSSIQFGNCLYQALVYNLDDQKKPVHKGKILSASRNSDLEKTIEDYLNNSKIDSLYNIYSNEKLKNEIIERLDKEAVVNIDLRSINKKRSLPLLTLSEYNNLKKNSSENLPIKTPEVSQELLTAIFKNLSEPNEAFKTFIQDLFTATFKNMSQDLFPGALENLSTESPDDFLADASKNSLQELLTDTFNNSLKNSSTEILKKKNSSQELLTDTSNNSRTETLKRKNSSNSMQPSLLSLVLILTTVYMYY